MTSARQARQERVDAESVFVTSGDPPAVSAQSSHKRSIAHSTIDAYGCLPESACFRGTLDESPRREDTA
jgi:hypothetical protein